MPTLEEVVKYEVRKYSIRIRDLKKDAIKTEKFLTWDGREVEIQIEHINPSHPRWKEYLGLKREASMWLAARRIQKTGKAASSKSHGIDSVAAQKRLDRTAKRLRKNPELFRHVVAWNEMKEMSHAS